MMCRPHLRRNPTVSVSVKQSWHTSCISETRIELDKDNTMAVALSETTQALAQILIPQAKGDVSNAPGEGVFGSLLVGEEESTSGTGMIGTLMAGAVSTDDTQEMSTDLVLSTEDLNLDKIITGAQKDLELSQLETSKNEIAPQNVTALPLPVVNQDALAELLPQTFKVLKSEEEFQTLDEVILSLQGKDEDELKAALAHLEALAEKAPQTFKEAFQGRELNADSQPQKPSLDKTLVALGLKDVSEISLKTEAQQEALKQARLDVLSEFSDIKGKVFRQENESSIKAWMADAAKSNGLLLKGQESKEAKRTLQEELNAKFEKVSAVEAEVRDEKTQDLRDALSQDQSELQKPLKGESKPLEALGSSSTETVKTVDGQALRFEPIQLATNSVDATKPGSSISQQIASQIQDHPALERFAVTGTERISIELKPEALGRVDIRLEMDKNGGVKVLVAADKVESLQALRQEVQTLEKSFNNLGFSSQSQDFQFEHRQNQSHQHAFARDEEGALGERFASTSMPITSYQLITSDRIDVQI